MSEEIKVIFTEPQVLVVFPGSALPDGTAVPPGGNTGQMLVKRSNSDYATAWADQAAAAGPVMYLTAGEALGGHRAVSANSEGLAIYADKDSAPMVAGITTGAVDEGSVTTIQISSEMHSSAWSFTPGQLVYLSTDGLLTQVPPASGSLVVLGTATGPTSLLINIEQPIIL
ncbi:MAG: hypothetical protein LWW75_04725 [Chlorobiales bacterium]|nr:hypothetical protein [Chlorobiales bacterium]